MVSDLGRVKSINHLGEEKILKPRLTTWGYHQVRLFKLKSAKSFTIHRLVATIFLGSSNLAVNHINCCKTDNRLENLEYVSTSANMLHASVNGLLNPTNKKKKVKLFSKDGEFIREFESLSNAKLITGISTSSIYLVCRGKMFLAGGYKWQYA